MAHPHVTSGFDIRSELDARIEQYRELILDSLAGLSDGQARAVVVEGKPSMLGIVRHTAYVEGVWFGEAITGESPSVLGLPVATANSWKTRKADTVESVTEHCRRVHQHSRENLAGLDLTHTVSGRGQRTILSIYLHVLSEVAWNTGQLDILRSTHTL